jgi:hypothetical protein
MNYLPTGKRQDRIESGGKPSHSKWPGAICLATVWTNRRSPFRLIMCANGFQDYRTGNWENPGTIRPSRWELPDSVGALAACRGVEAGCENMVTCWLSVRESGGFVAAFAPD